MPHMLLTSALVVGAALLDRVHLSSRRIAVFRGIFAGICFGFAASVRWTAVPIVFAILAASVVTQPASRRLAPLRVVSILAIALAVYMITYAPFFAEGHSLREFWTLHRSMAWFHSHIDSPTGQASPWYRWPFSIRGVLFGSRGGEQPSLSIATGNPVMWWLMPVVLAWSLWRWKTGEKLSAPIVCTAAVIAVWFPWAILSRSGLSYYLLPAAPFVAVLLSQLLDTQRGRRPWLYRMCLVGSVMLFIGMYPVLSAFELSPREAHAYRGLFLAAR
jgi:dolichyl-phosphate-mannose--protein O-mannosyl transferase